MMSSSAFFGAMETRLPLGQARGPDALAQAMRALADCARREVRLFAPQLQAAVFGIRSTADAVSGFLVRHPRNRFYLLVEDPAQARRDNDRLIEVARRLSDQLELRAVAEPDRGARELYLVADRSALLLQEDVARDEAMVTESRVEAGRMAERFDELWERAQPAGLRTLGL